jgi:hypothetical protein
MSQKDDLSQGELNFEEQKIALQIARQTLEIFFRKRSYEPEVSAYPTFQTKRGVFVTLRKNGELRGCIGTFEPEQNLAQTIQAMVLSAAFWDPRFFPLQENELPEIKIEISILSPRQKITNPTLIEVGKHGIYIQRGHRSGVYLPQVAIKQGWNREEFLNSLCEDKAGLEREAWRDGSAELYIFTVQVCEE